MWKRTFVLWLQLQALLSLLAKTGPLLTVTIPVSPTVRRAAALYVGSGGFTGMLRKGIGSVLRSLGFRSKSERRILTSAELSTTPPPPQQRVAFLHTNACGDFTLAAREHWLDLRAYPEFDEFSMNIDSVFCYASHHGGAPEEILPDPMRIYHIEHGTGSGWTPEGQAALFERIAAKGLTFVSYEDVAGWAVQMQRLRSAMIFNHDNWGLAEFDLEEHHQLPASRIASAQPGARRAGEPE